MRSYTVDEFLFDLEDCPISKAVDKKIELLYDFCVLKKRGTKADRRENSVRLLLGKCSDEYAMTHLLKDVVTFRCTIDELLDRKGVM